MNINPLSADRDLPDWRRLPDWLDNLLLKAYMYKLYALKYIPPLRWWFNVIRGLDVAMNGVLLGDGRETLSSRLGKFGRQGHISARVVCWSLDILMLEPYHCWRSQNHLVGYQTEDNWGILPEKWEYRLVPVLILAGLLTLYFRVEVLTLVAGFPANIFQMFAS